MKFTYDAIQRTTVNGLRRHNAAATEVHVWARLAEVEARSVAYAVPAWNRAAKDTGVTYRD